MMEKRLILAIIAMVLELPWALRSPEESFTEHILGLAARSAGLAGLIWSSGIFIS